MKNLVIVSLFISSLAFAQVPKLELTPKGIEPAVINVDLVTAADIYARTIQWLENNFENPDKVIVANLEGKEISIKAVEPKVWTPNRIGKNTNYDIAYTLKIEFKDGRYKVSYNLGNFEKNGTRLATSYKDLFKKFDGSVRYSFEDAVTGIEDKLNKRTESLYNYIMGVDNGDEW